MKRKPFPQSFWVVDQLLCAGCYPGDKDPNVRDEKLCGLLDCGIRRVLNLMEDTEVSHGGAPFEPYVPRLQELAAERSAAVDCLNFPFRDGCAPDRRVMTRILNAIDTGLQGQIPTYVHCWGGHGRTGTVIACHQIKKGHSAEEAIESVMRFRRGLPKNHDPFEGDQRRFIHSWWQNGFGESP
jgi:hypothetical protein